MKKQAAKKSAKQTEVQPEAVGEQKPSEQPKPEVKATATHAPATPSKQDATLAKLKAGWTEKKVDLSKMTVKDDGKFKNVIVAEGWPTVRIGASGGITVLELKSYPDAFTAAMEGLERYSKQQAREQKKATASTPAPAKAAEKQTATA
jgi:hypothetical protein